MSKMPNQLRVSGFRIPSLSIANFGFPAGCVHRFFVPVAGFSSSAWEQVPVSIEGNVNAGVSHLISNVCGRLAVGDQLAREKVAEGVKPCFRQLSPLDDRPPDVAFKSVWVNEAVAGSWKDESGIGVANFKVGEEPHHAVRGRNTAQRLARFRRPEGPLPLVNTILGASL